VTPPPEPLHGARLLFTLDAGTAYLNHGSFGAVPLPVQRAQQRLRDEMEGNPHRFFVTGLWDRIGHARRHLSTFLGADPANSAFVANATAAVSIVLNSIELNAGDEIITTSHGYAAVTIAVDHTCKQAGATHTVVPLTLNASDNEIVAAVTEAATAGRTKLVIIDQIASTTARVLPVARITAALRTRRVPVFVDGAHAPGAVGTPVDAIGADFWVGNIHKWLFAPRPTALFVVASHWRERIAPLVMSWDQQRGFPGNLERQGTLDYTAWLAAPTGVFVMRTLGIDRVRAHNAALVAYGQRVVGASLGLLGAADLPHPGGTHPCMRVLPLPAGLGTTEEDAMALRARITGELKVVVAVNPWRGRGLLRLSAQVYNHADEYDRLAAGLPRVLSGVR
jgi:isopenicillin-N epimerase